MITSSRTYYINLSVPTIIRLGEEEESSDREEVKEIDIAKALRVVEIDKEGSPYSLYLFSVCKKPII